MPEGGPDLEIAQIGRGDPLTLRVDHQPGQNAHAQNHVNHVNAGVAEVQHEEIIGPHVLPGTDLFAVFEVLHGQEGCATAADFGERDRAFR